MLFHHPIDCFPELFIGSVIDFSYGQIPGDGGMGFPEILGEDNSEAMAYMARCEAGRIKQKDRGLDKWVG